MRHLRFTNIILFLNSDVTQFFLFWVIYIGNRKIRRRKNRRQKYCRRKFGHTEISPRET